MSTRAGTPPKKRLLFFSLEDWNHVFRRNQFICAELCRRFDLEILWVGPVVDIAYALLRHDYQDLLSIQTAPRPVADQPAVKRLRPVKLLPNKIGRRFNDDLVSRNVKRALKTLGWKDFDIWINAQQARNYLPLPGSKRLIYDITDDWTKMPQPRHQLEAVIADDAEMLRQADHVIVCSRQLYESKKGKCRALTLIANGVDNLRYHPDQLRGLEPPKDLKGIAHPIVGYTGTLHSSRLDLALLEETAQKLEQVNFVFVGPNSLTGEETARLNRSNIHILGSRPYQDLPSYLASFDACMTPHLVNDFTESLDPLKLYEYMSTGKPIISTKCAGFRDYPDLITLAERENFSGAVMQALQETDRSKEAERSKMRVDWASTQSWGSRLDQVEKALGWTR